jgi:3-hydroxyacyl-CoA dehydrogenase/enoyl-CoA hydratase/3-hydroxybutyryl-CoA epimerase
MLFIESIETIRCFDEGVLRSDAEANIGSIMGIGTPPWTGGVMQYIKGYTNAKGETGPAAFVARAQELAAAHGDRFAPPASLIEASKQGKARLEG